MLNKFLPNNKRPFSETPNEPRYWQRVCPLGVTQVAIIGAGPAGLMAARKIREHGFRVTVLDKGRRPGGRTNTREHGPFRFDHGAQFFTVRDDRIRPFLNGWLKAGTVALWRGRFVRLSSNGSEPAHTADRYVGTRGMISIPSALAEHLHVRFGVRVERVERVGGRWRLRDDAGEDVGRFDQVVVAVPAAQAAPLLAAAPDLQIMAEKVSMAPAWAGMFAFEERPPMDFDAAFVADSDISWIARDASKPGRAPIESWVVHASPEWTRRQWDTDRSEMPRRIISLLEARFGPMPLVRFERAHRWGYALTSGVAPGVLYDAAIGIGVAGDWCVGGRVEGALVSGLEIADLVLKEIR